MFALNPQDASQSRHLHQLNATRALAALVVAVAHTLEIFWSPLLGTTGLFSECVATISQHAVVVFFLISGYLITQSIRRNATFHGTFSLSAYARDRLFRIYPPLIVALVICAVIDTVLTVGALPGSMDNPLPVFGKGNVMDRTLTPTASQWVSALLLLRTQFNLNVPLWSLFLEVKIYVAAGLVAAGHGAFRRSRYLPGYCAFGLAGLLIGLTCYGYGPRLVAYAPAWILGAALSLLHSASRPARVLLKVGACGACPVLLFTMLLAPSALSVLYGGARFHDIVSGRPTIAPDLAGPGIWANPMTMTAFGVLYAMAVFDWSWSNAFSRHLEKIAPWSYTLYLLNWPLLCIAYIPSPSWTVNDPLRIGLASVAALAVQMVLARKIGLWIERPAKIRAQLEGLVYSLMRGGTLSLRPRGRSQETPPS